MPPRTTPLQAAIAIVRQHYAKPGVVVTESKEFPDRITSHPREVDLVIEGDVDGYPMIVSIEITEHHRKATVEWVERMLQKHGDLPTNKLVLISKSGFVPAAIKKIEAQGGRVTYCTPVVITDPSESPFPDLMFSQTWYVPDKFSATYLNVDPADQSDSHVTGSEPVLDAQGTVMGNVSDLTCRIAENSEIRDRLNVWAHREIEHGRNVSRFRIAVDMSNLGLFSTLPRPVQTVELWRLVIEGPYHAQQAEVTFTTLNIDGQDYAYSHTQLAGGEHLLVRLKAEGDDTKYAWRVLKPPSAARPHKRPATTLASYGLESVRFGTRAVILPPQ